MKVPDDRESAIVHLALARLAPYPAPVVARVLGWFVDLALALPPDDYSVLASMVNQADLDRVVIAAWFARDPAEVRRQLDRAWRATLVRERLPYVPLPVIRFGPPS